MFPDRINEMKLSIIVPAYNSRKKLPQLIKRIRKVKFEGLTTEIIVVDDCSPDKTFEVVKQFHGITLIRHEQNTGKGGAVRTGLAKATGDILYIQDDDLEYDPNDIPRIIEPILSKKADVSFGSRHMNHKNSYSSLTYYLGGIFIDFLINLYLKSNITDALTGAKALTKKAYKAIQPIESNGFEIETEIAAKAVKNHLRISEIPIHYYPRTHKQGKKIRWHHAFRILAALAKFA